MLASMRLRFLLSFVVAFSVAVCLPVQAQVSGVPPSVTSIGFGGHMVNGVLPSVTSLGPNSYGSSWSFLGNCCANFFWPVNPNPPLISGHRRHHKDHTVYAVGVLEPAYIPYAPEADDDAVEADLSQSPVPPTPAVRAGNRDPAPKADVDVDEPVAAQPATVLVFKDGHQSDVLNYAIVGDTLFDFEEGRTRKIPLADLDLKATHKANDDRGVDFEVPAGATGQ